MSLDPIPREDEFTFEGPSIKGAFEGLFYAFNTWVRLTAYGDVSLILPAFEVARDECRRYERLFSRTLPHSDVTRINESQGALVEVDEETYRLCELAAHYSAATHGVFDITMGALTRLWDFHEGRIPAPQEIESARESVDWSAVHGTSTGDRFFIQLEQPAYAIDLGGIAKGYIADHLVELLLRQGLTSFMVNLGGNVCVRGTKPDGSRWLVGIKDPAHPERLLGAIRLQDASAVTSGIYERCFERDGRTYHHILSRETGMPAETDVAGVTVVATASIDAEGFSTALLLMGAEKGVSFARQQPRILQVYFSDKDGAVTLAKQV